MDGNALELEWDGEKESQHSDATDKSARFRCQPKRNNITIRKCLEDYTNLHAKKLKRSKDKCFKCRIGAANRIRWAFDLEPTERRIDAMVAISSTQGIKPWMWLCLKVGIPTD